MNPQSSDPLSLLENALYHEAIHSKGYGCYRRPVPYSCIADIRHSGWICTISGEILHPYSYYPAPLAHHLGSIEEPKPVDFTVDSCNDSVKKPLNSLPIKRIDAPHLVLPTKKTSSFGGQDQDGLQLSKETPTVSVFGEYWIEYVYKTINGITYGPYRLQRWRDGEGRKRSRYLGKPPTKTAAALETAATPTETAAPDSPA
jgi:hypothetical protein